MYMFRRTSPFEELEMITMNSSALGAALALALTGAAVAGPAPADSLRVQVGDLSTPAAARAFHQRIEIAAARLCAPSYALVDLNGWAYCRASVREQAMRQLTPDQQMAYAAALAPAMAFASR
jgi:UrcA family protein